MDGFQRRKEQSRGNILKATETLLAKHGNDKVSISDIASKAGVSQVTIYNLFGSKDSLIYDCIRIITNRLIEHFREVSKLDKPYPEKLEDIFNFAIEINESYPGLRDVDYLNHPQLRQLRGSLLEQERQTFLEFIKEGQKQGYLNPDLSDESIEVYFEVILQGMNSNPELHARKQHNPKLFHDFLLIMLYGFGKVR